MVYFTFIKKDVDATFNKVKIKCTLKQNVCSGKKCQLIANNKNMG